MDVLHPRLFQKGIPWVYHPPGNRWLYFEEACGFLIIDLHLPRLLGGGYIQGATTISRDFNVFGRVCGVGGFSS